MTVEEIKKAFEDDINALLDKYNAMTAGETIFLIGHRNLDTGYYTVDRIKSQLGKTFKDVFVLWRTQPSGLRSLGRETGKTG